MILDDVITAQKKGEARGITSICSAHPAVLQAAMRQDGNLLIESTCNQVNQFGGYTGMTPADFVRFVEQMAEDNGFNPDKIILGGDHLGPNVWQNEPADEAMAKSEVMMRAYLQAGFTKIHLDCSMRLRDDPPGLLDLEVSARRSARLAKVAEESRVNQNEAPRYVVGTEVPVPGGATEHEDGVSATRIEDLEQTIDCTRRAFKEADIESAWERVIAVVVQPGVEFGDDFIQDYDRRKAAALSGYIENQPIVYEAHSTDYQTPGALRNLVEDHFAILKVGPELTFAYREAVFALSMMEDALLPLDERSNFIRVLDNVMLADPQYWQRYYHGDVQTIEFARKYSLSDRIRYYWHYPQVQSTLKILFTNLNALVLPPGLVSQFAPRQYDLYRDQKAGFTPQDLVRARINEVLQKYAQACG